MQARTKRLLIALAAVAVVGGAVSEALKGDAGRKAEYLQIKNAAAFAACAREFKRSAHDPASVEAADDGRRFRQAGATASVDMMIRARNRLGALVLTPVRCDLSDAGEYWRVTALRTL